MQSRSFAGKCVSNLKLGNEKELPRKYGGIDIAGRMPWRYTKAGKIGLSVAGSKQVLMKMFLQMAKVLRKFKFGTR
jgi:hypothetical protein